MRVLWFGTYSVGPGYPRNTVLIEALRSVGVDVVECHAPLFRNAHDKVAAAGTVRGRLRFGCKALIAWFRLAWKFFRAGPRDIVVVGYTGHLDIFLARVLSVFKRRPLVLDAFLSLYDTTVVDRKLLAPTSLAARALFRFERAALRVADLVLTDTAAHADFMAGTFAVPAERFVPIPVGSLIEAPLAVPVPAPVGARGGAAPARPFTAYFCGTFVPLQGLPYILDAAQQAPDLHFHIQGDGPDGPRIAEEVAARDLANVRLERVFLPRSEIEKRLAAADAVLGVFGEGAKARRVVPCKVYDGLAAGLPVVTGGGPGPEELLTSGEDALLVDRDNPRSLVRALRRLRDDPALGGRLRVGARRVARERFGREALGLRLRAALHRVRRG
ncbi:MAG: glycosyltransferase [Planctomycetota bacterium]|nr:glycosyltransferase [Planctomycetota bacterium]